LIFRAETFLIFHSFGEPNAFSAGQRDAILPRKNGARRRQYYLPHGQGDSLFI
jgi:hypothetical protein